MKKGFYAMMALAVVLAGCSKEVDYQTPEVPDAPKSDDIITLRANVDPETKVSADNAGAYKWQTGDVISVLDATGAPHDFSTDDAATSADFSGSLGGEDLGKYAMFPASAGHLADVDEIVFNIPSTLTWSDDATFMPMLGKVVSETEVNFKAAGGVLKLVCFNIPSGAEYFEFIATNKQIVGDFTIADGKVASPTIATAAKVGSNNTLDIDFSADYSACKVFYIPLPTGTIDGFTVKILDSGRQNELFSKTSTANLTVAANKLILGPALNCAPATVLVSEDFSSYDNSAVPSGTVGGVSYSCTDGSTTNTTVKKGDIEIYAGGVTPEILIGKTGGTFKISGINCSGVSAMTLSFKKNGNALTVTATEGITVTGSTASSGTKTLTLTNVGTGSPKTPLSSFDLTFAAGSSNVRVDDILLTVTPASYTAPSLTPDEDALEIAVGSTDATTNFTYANKVDNLPVVAVIDDDAKAWLSAEIAGTYPDYTLTVSATGAHNGATDRTGTVTLRASGVKKAIAVTQKTKLVPNPTVATTPADGKFSASWTADANASSYVAYLHTGATATPASGGTDITSSISHVGSAYSITDYVTPNGKYYLYIKVNEVASGYEAPTAYVERSFTCEGTPKGSAVENPYTVAEAVAAYDANPSIGSKYVKGIVCQEGASYCFISDDGTTTNKFELYSFSGSIACSDLKVGDAVIAHGNLYYYSSGSMYEISGTTVDVHISKPTFTPNGANFVTNQSVAIASTGSSSIHYTTNGTAPTASTGSVYSSALNLSETTTVKAVGVDANAVVCTAVASATFTKVSAYAVTWSAPSYGFITVKHGETTLTSGDTVPAGETVTITATPIDGYALSTLVYNDGSEHDIKSSKSFTMPASAVSIAATFESGSPDPVTMDIFSDEATVTGSGASQTATWTSGDITVTAVRNAAGNTQFRSSDTDHTRFYSGWTITVSSASNTIDNIEITCTSNAYATTLAGYTFTNGSASNSSSKVTVSDVSAANTAVTLSAQVRISSITVNYE